MHAHLSQIMPPLLAVASQDGDAPGPLAAREALRKIVAAVAEDGLYLLIAQVIEKPRGRPGSLCVLATCGPRQRGY
jgi:hypothetical protein